MSLPVNYPICVFCCKNTDKVEGGRQEGSLERFIKLFARCVCHNNTDFYQFKLTCDKFFRNGAGLESCLDCHKIIDQFCSIYHTVKCLEMELEWKMRRLKNVMEAASRVPSRVELLKTTFENQGVLRDVTVFRRKFIQTCSRYLSKMLPKVVVRKHQDKCDDRRSSHFKLEVIPNPMNVDYQLISWFSSFAVVLLLYFSVNTKKDGEPYQEEMREMAQVEIEDGGSNCEGDEQQTYCDEDPARSNSQISTSLLEEKQKEIIGVNNAEIVQNDIVMDPDDRNNFIPSPVDSFLDSERGKGKFLHKKMTEECLETLGEDNYLALTQEDSLGIQNQEKTTAIEEYKAGVKATSIINCPDKPNDHLVFVDSAVEIQKRKGNSKFKCKICTKAYKDKSHLKRHIIRIHTDKKNWPISCNPCSLKFATVSDYRRHNTTLKHKSMMGTAEPNAESVDDNDGSLERNQSVLRDLLASENLEEDSSLDNFRLRSMFRCDICKFTFSSSSRLQRHTKLEHQNNTDQISELKDGETDYDSHSSDLNSVASVASCQYSPSLFDGTVNDITENQIDVKVCDVESIVIAMDKYHDNDSEISNNVLQLDQGVGHSSDPLDPLWTPGIRNEEVNRTLVSQGIPPTGLEVLVGADDHLQPATYQEKSPGCGPEMTTGSIETRDDSKNVCILSPPLFPEKVDVDLDRVNETKAVKGSGKSSWCDICKKTFVGLAKIQEHNMRFHTDKQKWPFTCNCCNLKFPRFCDFNRHSQTLKHKLKSRPLLKRKSVDEKPKVNNDVKQNQEGQHLQPEQNTSSDAAPKNNVEIVVPLRNSRLRSMFQCKVCKYTCSNKSRLESHVETAHMNIDESVQDEDNLDIDDSTNSDVSEVDLDDVYLEDCDNPDEMSSQALEQPLKTENAIENQQTTSSETLDIPGVQHANEKMFSCNVNYCKRRFNLKTKLLRHKKLHRRSSLSNHSYYCKEKNCTVTFERLEELENHKKLHGTFKCDFCTVEKEYAPKLALHEMSHSKNLEIQLNLTRNIKKAKLNTAADPKYMTDPSEHSKKQYDCPRCSFWTMVQSVYINHHLNTHLGLGSIGSMCPVCKAPLAGSRQVREHFTTQHDTSKVGANGVQRCDQCPAYFIRLIQLAAHKNKVHGKTDKITCNVCNKKFKTLHTLRYHKKTQHPLNIFNFICDTEKCGEGFENALDLERHKNHVHGANTTPREPVNCQVCNKQIAGAAYLKFHMKIHQENAPKKLKPAMPYVCEQCGKAFQNKQLLETHYLFHAGPDAWQFMCSICSKKCFSQQKLDEHQRTHTKEKPFICEVCGEKYAHRHNWRHHVTSKHSIVVPVKKVNKINFNSRKGRRKQESSFTN